MTKEEHLNIANERSGFNKHNGIKIGDFDDEHCIVEGELCNEAMNPWGMAHGGFVYSLCDVDSCGTSKVSSTSFLFLDFPEEISVISSLFSFFILEMNFSVTFEISSVSS